MHDVFIQFIVSHNGFNNHNLLLNKLPESFDPVKINWNHENIIKNKELVTSIFRIGDESIKIQLKNINDDGTKEILSEYDLRENLENKYQLNVADDFNFDRGLLSQEFLLENDNNEIKTENSYIIIYQNEITDFTYLLLLLEEVAQKEKPLLIISKGMNEDVLEALVENRKIGSLNVIAVDAPDFGERRNAILEDIALMTGGIVIDDETKINSNNLDRYFGFAEKVIVNNESTSLIKCKGDKVKINARINEIYKQIAESSSAYDKEKLFERLSNLTNQTFEQEANTDLTSNNNTIIHHDFDFPLCIPFLNKSNLVFNCHNESEVEEAIRISHNLIARTLLALQAGKTKLTFIDPLELGGNAAPFTPLLREIYGGLVFTQPNDIDTQLTTLTRAIENVIQKYLQDKFVDIAEYNLKTKEVPEPYRLLVVYNFPHGFNETTAKKLLNIIKSGPKSGVNTILINDKNAKLPYGLDWSNFIGINNLFEILPSISCLINNNIFEYDFYLKVEKTNNVSSQNLEIIKNKLGIETFPFYTNEKFNLKDENVFNNIMLTLENEFTIKLQTEKVSNHEIFLTKSDIFKIKNQYSELGRVAHINADTRTQEAKFAIILVDGGINKLGTVKYIKEILKLELKTAKEFVDSAPKVIFNNIKINELPSFIKNVEEIYENGATVEIVNNNTKKKYKFQGNKNLLFQSIHNEDFQQKNENFSKIYTVDRSLPFNEIVKFINNELPNVSSIKVPFTKYIAPQNEWWQEKAYKRFAVPIGRHALEVQNLKFDNDDDNQALLIGKPGSGKSNLLHVIIANSIWKYSPDQLEIYLIDFKGGVEFTIYADKEIPHIRTIAIESEREFGLSVLDGVERELLRRETEFSKAGVQNIEQYHERFPNERMPRVLLIVDEFQEFFAEDDNIKQAVDDKFDRIVRKGRAFGINTLFSSQTLSGNSIKKSTKELIDIRIALMCSDLDSNQILDDRNPAARDLTRPGEGIYNPENGKVEGNRRFQAFFIEKDELNKTIESVVSFAKTKQNGNSKFKQIIFRGSEKAVMQKDNHPLKNVSAVSAPKSIRLWVGEPVAIADDVTAVIRKQGGSNLLVAGYDENIGLRVMCSSIISIAAQHQPKSSKFYLFNFYNVDSELVNVPDELFKNIDQDCVTISGRQVKESLQEIKYEIENRLSGSVKSNTYIYLTFFSLHRGRAFRKDGYSMSEEGELLAYILKEGADAGVFSLVQVDTMDNFSKNLDDNLLKEFTQRIASQMNPDNSVKLIGNQKAAKLGSNRAWYYDDNENTMVKFKPYELPSFTWIKEIKNPQSTLS